MSKYIPDDQPELISESRAEYSATPEEQAEEEKYIARLRACLRDPEFRSTPGFPLGEDEDILALSDPPYYTACPNPFLGEIIEQWQAERTALREELELPDDSDEDGKGAYHREPFASDVSEGKNHPIYNAHSYHTKVPHKAIMRYILHYTDPGDIVFDGFCGTGMTGVAAQLCGDKKAVLDLEYHVDNDGWIYENADCSGKPISRLGVRKTLLNDLSPAATFIAYNYNTPINMRAFDREANRILQEVEEECGWMYETWHPHVDDPNRVKGKINHTVWSDVFNCPNCGQEMIFWDVAVDQKAGKVANTWFCPACNAILAKSPKKSGDVQKIERTLESVFDRVIGKVIQRSKQVPVLINYSIGKKRYEKEPDTFDSELIQHIRDNNIPYPIPEQHMMFKGAEWGETWRAGYHTGITHAHHFFPWRNLRVLASLWKAIADSPNTRLNRIFHLAITAVIPYASKMRRFRSDRKGGGPLSGTLYIASIITPLNVFLSFARNVNNIKKAVLSLKTERNQCCIMNQSATRNIAPVENVVDYIFVDPPFGGNLMYSELNFLWEAWLRVFTNNQPEAIISREQRKGLAEYQELMEACFSEFYQLLRPGRWMTVEFHNSKNAVWNAIQEAILRVGFMIADVRILDKQQGTFKQVTTSAAVKQDLIISAYKPRSDFERRFRAEGGSLEGAWAFIRQHLEQLPIPALQENGLIESLTERQAYLLYDRMVAFHIQRGLTVPLSAPEFYQGLHQRLLERDEMYFTPPQAAEYDKRRMGAERVEQLALFVSDEKSAIQWLRQQFSPTGGGKAQTYQEIQPKFLRELHQSRHEDLPELRDILEENFLQDEHDRWYTPDPDRQADLEALRQRTLLREFNEYLKTKGKLRTFRSEAIREGFSHAWRKRDYGAIVKTAERLPASILEEDQQLLMYVHNAGLRYSQEPTQPSLL